jgi:phage repressor protein C with HTH and peptisase S24 domain
MIEKSSNRGPSSILDAGFKHGFEDRFNFVLAMVGSVGKAADLCGVNRGTIPKWAKSEGKLPMNAALALCNEAGVTLDWLATGHHIRPQAEIPGFAVVPLPEQTLDLTRIPLLGSSGAGGAGAENRGAEAQDHIYMLRDQLGALGVSPDAVRFLRARGDAMAPTIAPGAIALVDTAQRVWAGDSVYAISLGGEVLLRRLSKGVEGGFMLIPDNARYPTERLADLDGLQIEGRAIWTEHRL